MALTAPRRATTWGAAPPWATQQQTRQSPGAGAYVASVLNERRIPPPPGARYVHEHSDGEPANAEQTTPNWNTGFPVGSPAGPHPRRRATSMPRAHDMPPLVDGPEARPPWAAPAAGVWGNGTPGGTGWGADAGAGNGWGANGGWAAPGGGGGGGGGGWGAAGHSDGGGAAAGGWEDWAAPAGRPGPDPWATGPEQPSPHGWDMHDFDDSPSRDQEPVPDSYFAPRNEAPPSPWHPSAGQTPGPTWGNLAGMNSPYPPQSWSSSQTPPSRGLSTPRTPASTDQPVLSRSFFGGLGRSASQTQPRPRHNKRSNSIDVQRSVSDAYGPGPHYRNGWKPTEGYGPHEPARRPREWRPEYSVRPGLTSYIPRGRRDTVVDEFTDPMRRKLSYLLAYATPPPVFWDIRYDFNYVNCLNFPCLRRQHNEIDFYQIASEPPVERMRLVHHRLPWYIEVLQNRPNGITVGDIIRQMFEQLSMSILMKDYWNEEMTESDREKITSAYRKRCKEDAQELSKGVKRVDYLGERVIFEGLHKKGGVWEIKLKKKLE